MNTFIIFITSFISVIVLDFIWLGIIMKPFNTKILSPWMTGDFKLWPAVVVYVLLALGTAFFVFPKVSSLGTAALYGAFLGLIIYGVYDMTNLAIITGWPLKFALVDMAWGTVSGGLIAMIVYFVSKLVK